MRPLTILQVTDFYPPVVGGLEHHVDALASGLSEHGHKVHIATLTKDAVAGHQGVTVHPVEAVGVRRLPHVDPSRPFHPPLPDPTARRRLRRILELVKPDVVHGHSWLALSLPPDLGRPLVHTVHDFAVACPRRTMLFRDTTVCSGPALVKCARCLLDQQNSAKAALLSVGTPIGRRLMRADATIVVSDAVHARLSRWIPDAHVIPNFVAMAEPSVDAESAVRNPEAHVMFGGDPSVHKGFAVLVSCWQGTDALSVPLVVASSRWSETPLPPRVQVRFVPHTDMHAAWSEAAVAVVPSIWPDPAPTVVLEAMAAGTPVVASRIGGIPELIRDGVEGLLVAPGNACELKAAIRRVLDDPGLARRLGDAGRQRAAQYSAAATIPRIEEVYRQVVDARSNAELSR